MDIIKEAVSEFYSGSGTVDATAAQLHTGRTIVKWVIIKAAADLGAKTISIGPAEGQAAGGFVLTAGQESPPICIDNLNKVWLIGSDAGCGYSWIAV